MTCAKKVELLVGLYRLYKIDKCHTRKLASSMYRLSKQNDRKGSVNPLTPKLNSSAQRCLTRFFTVDFAS
jgi:hypothetical protein